MKKLLQLNLVQMLHLQKAKRKLIYACVVVLFIVANVLVSMVPLRFDFSFGKSYTLSSSTAKILNQLHDVVTLKLYTSSELPTQVGPLKTDVVDLLNEYKRLNPGKIQVKILDPKTDAQAQKDAASAGIPQVQFSQMQQDKYAISNAYFGMTIGYAGKQEVIPQVSDIGGLEYNISASIFKLSRTDNATVGYITQSDALANEEQASNGLLELLRKQFDVVYPGGDTATESATINPNVKTLLVLDSKTSAFSDSQIQAMKEYLQKNGTILLFADGVWVADDLTSQPAGNGLAQLLQSYGITINPDLILSAHSELINFGNGQVQIPLQYPYWVLAQPGASTEPYFTNTTQFLFPWTSSLSLKATNGYQSKALIQSSNLSWNQTGTFTLNPQDIVEPKQSDLHQYILAAQSSKKNGGTLIVIPSSRFPLDQYQGRTGDNISLILNIINTYTSNGLLTGISQRSVNFYPLPNLPDTQKELFKYVVMLGLPILFGILGALHLVRRK